MDIYRSTVFIISKLIRDNEQICLTTTVDILNPDSNYNNTADYIYTTSSLTTTSNYIFAGRVGRVSLSPNSSKQIRTATSNSSAVFNNHSYSGYKNYTISYIVSQESLDLESLSMSQSIINSLSKSESASQSLSDSTTKDLPLIGDYKDTLSQTGWLVTLAGILRF